MEKKPLSGVRVLDFTWVRAGPWGTRWLAVLGAEVIKVEWPDPRLPLNGRYGGIYNRGPNDGGHFSDTNAQKLSVTINVRNPKGFEIIKRLLAMSDVVVENFSSEVMRNWKLSYADMVKVKPDIIYVSMAGLGQTGPNHHYATMGGVVQALCGLTHVSGLPDKPPAGWGWSYMDDTGGMYGAMAVLAALCHRQQTGQGQHVDMAQVGTGMTLLGPAFLDLNVNGRGSRRPGYPPGNRTVWPGAPVVNNYRGATTAPHNAYRTAGEGYNDWCVIACFSDSEWRALVDVMGSPAWAQDERFGTVTGRIQHQEELDRNIGAWAKTMEKYEVAARCQAAGVRSMPVQTNENRVEHDPQLREYNVFTPLPHAVLGTKAIQGPPFVFSETPTPVERPGPLLGEHNVHVLGEMLGLSLEEIRAGYEDGTFWPGNVPIEPYLLDAVNKPGVKA